MGAFASPINEEARVTTWVEQFVSGNRSSADLLAEHVRSVLRKRFLGFGFPVQVAEDLVQESAVQVFRSIDQYDPSKGSVDSWLSGYARNVARTWWRNRALQMQSEMEFDPHTDLWTHMPIEIGGSGILEHALTTLDPIDQELLHMRFAFGYSFEEISQMSNLSPVNARKRVSRAVEALRNNPLLREAMGFK